ncbi:MAG: aminotransferase class V-fold PLP-dependent enzyme [Chitinophagales bacterium]
MSKYSFKYDFSEGCHPRILEALTRSNSEQQGGYGTDEYSRQAKELLRAKMNRPNADIYFVSGGTQANLIVISAILHTFEAVVSAKTGHIQQHEAGAIEATGHRIETIEKADGKLTTADIQPVLDRYFPPHTIKPKMVYLTHSTELGTIYTKSELQAIWELCQKNDLYLYIDGARIGAALCAENSDLSLEDLAAMCDVFYIGGTKNGALLGEAIVINNEKLKVGFESNIKQRGGLLAKGRLLGIQFLELFRDDLFFELARHANRMAQKIRIALKAHNILLISESPTNQLFAAMPNPLIEKLSEKYDFYTFYKYDAERSVVRLVTSWTTEEAVVEQFIEDLTKMIS